MTSQNDHPPIPPSGWIRKSETGQLLVHKRPVEWEPFIMNPFQRFAFACMAEVEWRKIYGLRLDRYMRNTDERSHGDTYKIDEAIENADAWREWGEKENEG